MFTYLHSWFRVWFIISHHTVLLETFIVALSQIKIKSAYHFIKGTFWLWLFGASWKTTIVTYLMATTTQEMS